MEDKRALDYSLKLLSKKDYTIFEMRQKMKIKEFDENIITDSIEFLISKKFLDDEKFALRYWSNHPERGKIRIHFELKHKGVSEDIIDKMIQDTLIESEEAKALNIGRKWLRNKIYNDADKYKVKQNLCAKLYRQGFDYSISKKISDQLIR